MQDGLALLEALPEQDVAHLLQGRERQVISGTELIAEGKKPTALFFVLEGLVEVTVAELPGQAIARLGPGEVFGEIAFLEDTEASATVAALENSLLLEVPWTDLQARLDDDPGFAARFYRAIARVQAGRLRHTTRRAAATLGSAADQLTRGAEPTAASATWTRLQSAIDAVRSGAHEAEQAAIRNGGELPKEVADGLIAGFHQFAELLHHEIGDHVDLGESARAALGLRVQKEVLPYVMSSELGERIYVKPRGYAGDFKTIDIMYGDRPHGTGRLGPAIDRAFRERPANRAVMNRRGLLAEEIGRSLESANGKCYVTSLASGPAAELFDVFGGLADRSVLKATCIDIDYQALGFVSDRAEREKLQSAIDLHNGNLVYLAMGRRQLELPPQDLMYSIGLIDYFADKFVRMLLDWVHDRLRPGGRVILGNFHTNNVDKALMDHVFDWRLIHRSEDDMNRLFESSKFGRPCSEIRFEEAGVNLFASCIKDG